MKFKVLGSKIEYAQAAKRLEQIANAEPHTPEAQELKELLKAFIQFEKEIHQLEVKKNPKINKTK